MTGEGHIVTSHFVEQTVGHCCLLNGRLREVAVGGLCLTWPDSLAYNVTMLNHDNILNKISIKSVFICRILGMLDARNCQKT